MRIRRVMCLPPGLLDLPSSHRRQILRTCVELARRSSLACSACAVAVPPEPPRSLSSRCSPLAFAAGAEAAAWQGPATISEATVNARPESDDRARAARATPSPPGGTTRTAAASRSRASAREEPGRLRSPSRPRSAASTLFPAVDGNGNISLAYTSGARRRSRRGRRARPRRRSPRSPARRSRSAASPSMQRATPCSPATGQVPAGTDRRLPAGPDRGVRPPHVSLSAPAASRSPSSPRARDQRVGHGCGDLPGKHAARDHAHARPPTGPRRLRMSRRVTTVQDANLALGYRQRRQRLRGLHLHRRAAAPPFCGPQAATARPAAGSSRAI